MVSVAREMHTRYEPVLGMGNLKKPLAHFGPNWQQDVLCVVR